MAKKVQTVEEVKQPTITVRLLKTCVPGGAGAIVELEPSRAKHLILMEYAEEISSGESGQKNTDTPTD